MCASLDSEGQEWHRRLRRSIFRAAEVRNHCARDGREQAGSRASHQSMRTIWDVLAGCTLRVWQRIGSRPSYLTHAKLSTLAVTKVRPGNDHPSSRGNHSSNEIVRYKRSYEAMSVKFEIVATKPSAQICTYSRMCINKRSQKHSNGFMRLRVK
jgi:hypothetical protein